MQAMFEELDGVRWNARGRKRGERQSSRGRGGFGDRDSALMDAAGVGLGVAKRVR